MNNTNTNKSLMPVKLITVYKDRGNYASNYYLEGREIKNENGNLVFMAPAPLEESIMLNIAKSYTKNKTEEMEFKGFIDGSILYATNKDGKTIVMWYRPAATRILNFAAQLKIKSNPTVKVPALLFLIMNRELFIYGLQSSERPDMKTKLYNAPFFNIYENGNVCLGTANVGKQKTKTFEGEIERFERGFFMAEQNHGQIKNTCKTSLPALWKQLLISKKPFPSKEQLLQHKKYKTVGDLMTKLIGNKNIEQEDEE